MPTVSLTTIVAGSSEFGTYNGPAFPGYASTDGGTQTACLVGEFQPSAYSQACITCREGYYCPITGLSSLENYLCSPGYYCGNGLISATGGTICPYYTFCESGSVFDQRCADGYKNPLSMGAEACQTCGSGSFCYQTESSGMYTENIMTCPNGNTQCTSEILKRELKCQDGYYLDFAGTS